MHLKLIEDFSLHPKQFLETTCTLYIQFVSINSNKLFSTKFLTHVHHEYLTFVFF